LDALALRTERQSAQMSKIKNSGSDQYGTEPFGLQQFGTAGVEEVSWWLKIMHSYHISAIAVKEAFSE